MEGWAFGRSWLDLDSRRVVLGFCYLLHLLQGLESEGIHDLQCFELFQLEELIQTFDDGCGDHVAEIFVGRQGESFFDNLAQAVGGQCLGEPLSNLLICESSERDDVVVVCSCVDSDVAEENRSRGHVFVGRHLQRRVWWRQLDQIFLDLDDIIFCFGQL